MTTENQPAWATDPRGLPPAVQTGPGGAIWTLDAEDGTYWCGGFTRRTPAALEADYGPGVPLWPDTPATSPLPDAHIRPRITGVSDQRCTRPECACPVAPSDIARALLTESRVAREYLESELRIATAGASFHKVVVKERDLAWAELEAVKKCLTAEPTEAEVEAAQWLVDSTHQFQGDTCLCGFRSPVSRQRTEHITGALSAALRAAAGARR